MEAAKVGVRIQEVRRARGLTQAELAQAVDITPKYLSNIECGAKIRSVYKELHADHETGAADNK